MMAIILWFSISMAQEKDETTKKERLDFAKTYFELGGSFMPSFTGKRLISNQVQSFEHSASINPYITWGGFHFWGHTEFYVTIPLKHISLDKKPETDFELKHFVTTGARLYPWAIKEKKIRPYVGFSWGALNFKQKIKPDDNQTALSKDFMLNYEAGITYNYKKLAFRLGINYLSDNEWDYPLSTSQKTTIKTPKYTAQLGLLYTIEATKNTTKENIKEWNQYPRVAQLSHQAKRFGDFFIGVGPSGSYSLKASDYNKTKFPYLKERLVSKSYYDISAGYQFNKANLFAALSFRNPSYETKGFATTQIIKKNSLALEINKYLMDYTGFAPYIGLNIAYDMINYQENVNGVLREIDFDKNIEPGLTFGWDIVPGKTNEAIILRTNLRWYPKSNFGIDGHNFDFSQLEYNLIQVVFYPTRLLKK